MESADAIVVGGGFGGLGAALGLAERGARVVLLERLGYLGGCASTFAKGGARYESGATVLAGLGEGQVLRGVIDRYRLPVELEAMDPVLELRWGRTVEVPADRDAFVERLCAWPGAPADAVRRAFAEQGRLSRALWELFDDPTLLPPWSPATLVRLAARGPALAPLARWVGRPLRSWLAARGLLGFEPVERFAEALCQVTVQASPAEAEAPFGLAALDFPFHGVRHVRGGVGELAGALGRAVASRGSRVELHRGCTGLERVGGDWVATTKRGPLRAPILVANLAPHALRTLLGRPDPELDRLAAKVETGWGAVMSYRQLRKDGLPARPYHLDLVREPARPLTDGNHVFLSISEPRADGIRTLTASTHVRLTGDPRAHVEWVQAELRATLRERAPELEAATIRELPASPRTFARFVGRPGGWVGGAPRRAGLAAYAGLWPCPVDDGLWLVGDAVLLGQSTLATFVGGLRTAAAIEA